MGGLTLGDYLRIKAIASTKSGQEKAVILFNLAGGPSHVDMYDPKPDAPAEIRGEFKEIPTRILGIRICEHLPLQAARMDRMAIIRSVTHGNAAHGGGTHLMLTGHSVPEELTDNRNPSCGSVTALMRGANRPQLPPYVCVPNPPACSGAAYLGMAYNPFTPGGDPNDPNFKVRDLQLGPRVDLARFRNRRELLGGLDKLRRDLDIQGAEEGYDRFYRDAFDVITSSKCRDAFDIHKEDPRLRDRYGRDTYGQSALLARRLIEAGVTFTTVYYPGLAGSWDTHANNFETLKNQNLPGLDRVVSALLDDLRDRGMDRNVLVMGFGEFGRTPRVNGTAGRDHWPGALSVFLAGGGLKMGQVIGSTDTRAEYPRTRPLSPQDLLATLYKFLDIDYRHVFYDAGQRPIPIVHEGNPIEELF
jgi:hypothetical protein